MVFAAAAAAAAGAASAASAPAAAAAVTTTSAAAAATVFATSTAALNGGDIAQWASLLCAELSALIRVDKWLTESYVNTFEFVPGQTWLSTWYVWLVAPAYLAVVWALKAHVKRRGKPYDLKAAVILHNSILSISSAVLFLALLSELLRMAATTSPQTVFCDEKGQWTKGRIYFLYYLNYMFKFVELWDTCLLALRNKPTPFLHVYHHAATLILCWSQMYSQSCMQWVVIGINLFVHIVMYLYYALHAIGIDVWWKRYLTVTQIVQFVVALTACWAGLGPRILNHYGFTSFPHCWGSFTGAFFGVGILSSYLLLFVQLYRDAYHKPRSAKPAAGAAVVNGTNGNGTAAATNGAEKPKFA